MIIKGSIEDIIFRNDENGYTVLSLDSDGDNIVCVGVFPPVSAGEYLSLDGEYLVHAKFGKQFKVKSATISTPNDVDAIAKYLGSGVIKGIGPITAYNIVNKFKEKTLDVIEFTPHLLTSVKGITQKKAEAIASGYTQIKTMKDGIIFLQSSGVTLNMALKIYDMYKDDTISTVKSNPYILIEHIDGIGFASADKIAQTIGIEKNGVFRIRAGIIYVLKLSSSRGGNTCLPKNDLVEEVVKLINVESDLIESEINDLILSSKIKNVKINDDIDGFMLSSLYRVELDCAYKLVDLLLQSNKIKIDCKTEIKEFEVFNKMTLHSNQIEAVETAVNSGISVITGGPGTGKTTIVKCILSVFEKFKYKTLLMAPTGRAAKRLSESTGMDASTIHRAIKKGQDEMQSQEKLEADVIIIDEVSMIDVYLLSELLGKINVGTRIIFVGDKDQLPSVGAGNVLSDILNSKIITVVSLTQIYRQGEDSLITTNAHLINNGKMPNLDSQSGDFFHIGCQSQEQIRDKVLELVLTRLPKYLKCEPVNIQILSPMKNGLSGTINLNNEIAHSLRKIGGAQVICDEQIFKEGDKVMHVVNNYDLEWTKNLGYKYEHGEGVFNGDLGYIYKIRADVNEMDVLFEDSRLVTYTQKEIDQLILAYAITVHKSQGSEFDAVIVPIYGGNPIIMTKNLLYTAITRAKKLVVLVGNKMHIKKMIENDYIATRYSKLKDFIIEAHKKNGLLF